MWGGGLRPPAFFRFFPGINERPTFPTYPYPHSLEGRMSPSKRLSYGLLALAVACSPEPDTSASNAGTNDAIWFEGARLITGDGGTIESSAFLVEGNTFSWVGREGEMESPDGALQVDLTGKTVIPALIDGHQHIGLTNVKDGTNSKDNYTREILIEHLERSAYHGVAATMSLGLEFDEPLAFELAEEVIPDAALFLTSGRGLAGTSMAGPQQDYRIGIPRGALTEEEGRASVQELRALGSNLVKVWVDDRGGSVPKVEPNVLRAIVDEAHANGMRVVTHVGTTSALADAKDIILAGVDGFAHTVRDRDVDEEYLELVREHPEVWSIPNLPGNPLTLDDLPWLAETLPPFEIERMRAQIERQQAAGPPDPNSQFPLQCRNMGRNHEAGMVLGMGTDSGTSVAWPAHSEIRDMVNCGLTPMEGILAATSVNAEILRLDDLGLVAEGKSASFVVLNANPLDDINNTHQISDVYLRGERIDREALRAKFMDGVM